jgi:CRP-like cAMP-binding protein
MANGFSVLSVDRTTRARSVSRQEETTLADDVRKQVSIRNRILAGLPRKEYARIVHDLAPVTLKSGQVLYEPGGLLQSAYFLDTAIVSILSVAEDGTSIEVSVVGDEGVIGIPIVLRTHGLPYKIVVQAPGMAWRMKADVLRREFDRCGSLHKLVLHHLHTLIVVLSQSGACNRFHTVQQRLCRWLLTSQDRARSSEIQSTQELLSQTLGVNRVSASQAAKTLQRAGLITYRRGRIAILDRSRLEAAACECYRVVRGEFDRYFRTWR